MVVLSDIAEVAAAPRVRRFGADLPARFAGLEAEYRAVRQNAGVYDASFRQWLRAVGDDRVDFMQGMLSNDVRALRPGGGTYATLLTQQGKIVSDLRVYAAEDHLLLDLPSIAAAAARAALEKLIVADDVELEPLELVLLGIEGPRFAEILQQSGAAVPPGDGLAWNETAIGGVPVRLALASHSGEVGALLGCAPADAAAVWAALRRAGAEPVGAEALDALRIEAGVPWMGVDMDDGVLVMEAGLAGAVSFTKGCYLGQEVVERVSARGHVNRRRAGLEIPSGDVQSGAALFVEARDVGHLTSVARVPGRRGSIGMGYVRREHLDPGTELEVGSPGSGVRARLAPLPFHSVPATKGWPDVRPPAAGG